ncbi:MAG TPA: DUF29 domain-containing protein [Kamptonema sp.]|nr:DUF29 domain-containing protein [Kamptonema sp.]
MVTELGIDKQSLYEADYLKWIETTVEKLRSQDFSKVDWENLIEEIESMGRSERRSLESNLIIVIMHLLKWQFQPELRSRSWKSSIFEHRRRIRNALEDSPSLKPYLEDIFAKCYSNAVESASIETGLPLEVFPQLCPYTSIEVLDSNFLPDDNAQ